MPQYNQESYVESDNRPVPYTSRAGARGDRAPRHSYNGHSIQESVIDWHTVKMVFLTLGALAFIVVIVMSVRMVSAALPYVGILAIACAVVLLLSGTAWVVISLLRHATKADFYDISENGAYTRDILGRARPLAPMIAAPAKVNRVGKVEITPEVPTLFDLIEAGEIEAGQLTMVMGYDKAQLIKGILQLVVGPWPGTHAIAGKGRSGKTRRVVGEIAQALIGGARVIICDPHATKPDSLTNTILPLEKYLIIARDEAEILKVSRMFLREMYARQDDKNHPCVPWLIVYDEWSRLMNPNNPKLDDDGREELREVAVRCSTEFAGYLGFCCLIGQLWTQEAAGGTDVRRSLQSVFVHQLSAEYAKFFFRGAKWQNRAEELKRRECIYRDTDSQVSELLTIGIPDDTASRVSMYLASIGFPAIAAPASANAPTLPDYTAPRELREQVAYPYMIAAPGQTFTAQEVHPEDMYSRSPAYSSGESQNTMKEPVAQGERMEDLPLKGESLTLSGESFTVQPRAQTEPLFTREQETAIIKVAFQISQEKQNVTREEIKRRLGWNNKMHSVVKAVCDKHEIAR